MFFISFISPVKGEIYYSEYGSFSDFSTDEILSDDLIKVETEERYRYYHENIVGHFFIEGENTSDYPFVDMSNELVIGGPWQYTYPEVKPNQKISTRQVYGVIKPLPIRYIKISNVRGGNNHLIISEIIVSDKNDKVDFSIICDKCNENFESYVKNGVVLEQSSFVSNGGEVIIDLNDYYDIDFIQIIFYMYDTTIETKKFDLAFTREIEEDPYYYVNYEENFISTDINGVEYTTYNMNVGNIKWTEEEIFYTPVLRTKSIKINEYTQYNAINKYFYYYNIIKEYSDTYSDYYDNKDDKSITYYRYKKRDKIEVNDYIIITNKEENIDNFIKSTVPYQIKGDIDYTHNGIYKVTIVTPFKEIKKDIVVISNKENSLSDNVAIYNEYISSLNDANILLEKTNLEKEKYKNLLSAKENEKNIMQKQYENELLNLKMQKEDINISKIEDDSDITYQNKRKWLIIIIILLLLISIISLVIEIKNKNKN